MSASRTVRPLSVLAAGALLLASPLLLAGCGLIPNPVENIVEGVTGGDVELPGQSLPDDFPGEVPLLTEDVVFGGALGNDTERIWNVTIRVGEGALEQIAEQLEGAGFALQGEGAIVESLGTVIAENESAGLGVVVVVTEDDSSGELIANYTVTRAAGQ